jgi:predicted porin
MHQSERTQYSLTLTANTRDNLGGSIALPNQRTSLYEATVLAQRELRMDLTGHVSSSFSYANEAGGHDRIVTVEAGLSYALSKTLNVYLLDQYLYREIHGEVNVTSTTLSEDLAVIGLRRSF